MSWKNDTSKKKLKMLEETLKPKADILSQDIIVPYIWHR